MLWPRTAACPEALRDCVKRGILLSLGTMQTLGVLVGSGDKEINTWLADRVSDHKRYFDLILHPDLPVQIAMLLLRLSAVPMMGYLSRTVTPRLLRPHAIAFDTMVMDTCIQKLSLPSPLPHAAQFTLNLPIRLGGFGLRSVFSVSIAAYFSAVAQSVPDILASVDMAKRPEVLSASPSQALFARQVDECLNELLVAQVPCGPKGLIPIDCKSYWETYGKDRGAPGLQRGILANLENTSLQGRLVDDDTRVHEVHRLRSAAAKNAGAWLTSYPVTDTLSLSDDDYTFAAKHRLGLPYANGLPDACECGADLLADTAHFQSCHSLRGTAVRAP